MICRCAHEATSFCFVAPKGRSLAQIVDLQVTGLNIFILSKYANLILCRIYVDHGKNL